MWDHEQRLLASRRHEASNAKQLASWGVSLGALFSVLLATVSFLTINRDIKTLRLTSRELAASEAHYRLLTETTSDLVRLLDAKGAVTYVSPSVEALLGYGVDEFLALPAKSLMHPDEVQIAVSILADIESKTLSSGSSTYRLLHRDGAFRWFEVQWSVHRDTDGAVRSIHTVGRDVTERKRRERMLAQQAEQLRDLSTRDELTQLYNRRGFLQQAEQARVCAVSEQHSAALVFIDLNGMKRINDELGHDAGDDALKDAAAVISAAVPATTVVGRLGGDEFVAFAVGFSSDDLEPLRRRLRSLSDERVASGKRPYRISMSVGAAFTAPDSTGSLDELIDGADAAMYEQKRARHAAGGVSLVPPPERS
jgi:diguanylate cyclase (GGDEF)-like protein/PAS domain S-box-containing protein